MSYRKTLPADISEDIIAGAVGNQKSLHELVGSIINAGNSPLVMGNQVELLVDGPATFSALAEAIKRAKNHIHIETYIFADDKLGSYIKNMLIAKAAEGVAVRVIYDAFGSMKSDNGFFEEMREQGIQLIAYRPLTVKNILPWRANKRDHRKLAIIDGNIAFTGGINISESYKSSSSANIDEQRAMDEGWRDTHVRIDGPAVSVFQQYFLETWIRSGGELKAQESIDQLFPKVSHKGSELVAAVASHGDEPEANIYASYLAAIRTAKSAIYLTNAYFVPNDGINKALIQAAHRGVDVRVLVPGFTDSSLAVNASKSNYGKLLKNGVRIFERENALLHAKTAVFDHAVSIVGSANLDVRSFIHNNEINAIVVSNTFARKLENTFWSDLAQSKEIRWKEWQDRPIFQRAKEFFSSLFSYWL